MCMGIIYLENKMLVRGKDSILQVNLMKELNVRTGNNQYLLFINRVCFSYSKILRPRFCLKRNLKLVFVWEYTKTGKSILRPAFDQSNCKKVGPALILIERHIIKVFITVVWIWTRSEKCLFCPRPIAYL